VGIEIRQVLGYEELERWVELRNEVVPDDPVSANRMALIRASELARVDIMACEDGRPVGTGLLAGDPRQLESTHPHVEALVPERYRGRGVGTALLKALSRYVRAAGKEGLHLDAREHDPYSIAFLKKRGFVEVGRLPLLALDLVRADTPGARPPAGVELTWLADRPDVLEGMFRVAEATYPEHGGHIAKEARTFQEWQLYELGDPRVLFDMTAIALENDAVVGFATMVRLSDEATAAHRITTVLTDKRRQGIGRALTCAQIAAAKRAGLRELTVWQRTDLIRRLHEGLGYRPTAVSIDFHGPLLDERS
jgi:GNAT superfamily N-acetyltransferase